MLVRGCIVFATLMAAGANVTPLIAVMEGENKEDYLQAKFLITMFLFNVAHFTLTHELLAVRQ